MLETCYNFLHSPVCFQSDGLADRFCRRADFGMASLEETTMHKSKCFNSIGRKGKTIIHFKEIRFIAFVAKNFKVKNEALWARGVLPCFLFSSGFVVE